MPILSTLTPAALRHALLALLGRRLAELEHITPEGPLASHRTPPELLRARTVAEVAADLRRRAEAIRAAFPLHRPHLEGFERLVQDLLDAATPEATDTVVRRCDRFLRPTPIDARPSHGFQRGAGRFGAIRLSSDTALPAELERLLIGQREAEAFLAGVMDMLNRRRRAGTPRAAWSIDDLLAVEHAYQLLDLGVRLPRNHAPILTDPLRPHQTYLFLADPGDGHLSTIVHDASLLDGLVVHVEHIDRDGVDSTEEVEAYRVPALRNAGRVRMHVGAVAPVSCYVGRPVFESRSFSRDLLKAAHLSAATCSALFSLGVADCKLAMDGMTASQAIDFMQVVAGNVIRDVGTQRLSAAFNINRPLEDDARLHGGPRTIVDAATIAARAVDLVVEGRFDKIAWDGASNRQPSLPIIGQLSPPVLLDLVHGAHERGLESYVSAGLTATHMRTAAFIGVGGVGIGTSLHHSADPTTHLIGPLDPEKVRLALSTRNAAAALLPGRAAATLAQLDWRYAEGSLPLAADPLRRDLHACLRRWHEVAMARFADVPAPSPLEAEERSLLEVMTRIERSGVLAAHEHEHGSLTPPSRIAPPDHAQLTSVKFDGPIDAVVTPPAPAVWRERPEHPLIRRARRVQHARRCPNGAACPPGRGPAGDAPRLHRVLDASDAAGLGEPDPA